MATVTAFEAKTRFGELLERVSKGVRVDHEMSTLAFSRHPSWPPPTSYPTYDAAYLELAQRRGLELGCKDGPLRTAARRAGIPPWS